MDKRPVCLIIRDGWGMNPRFAGNSVFSAKTPVIDRLRARYPWCRIECSGEEVGLPDGYQGSSEVGHLNMGAGRIVEQELKRIDDGLKSGELFKSPKWEALIANWKANKSQLHLMGLLQDEGVHAHQEHLFKIMRRARQEFPEGRIVVHPFLDGRDTPPRSTLEYLAKLQGVMAEVGGCAIGTAMGRYYAMDRSKNWALTSEAFACLVDAKGRRFATVEEAVKAAYDAEKTPDGDPMTDEYIPCSVIGDYAGIQDGDSVMHTNYRQDRAIQLTQAFVCDDYAGARARRPKVVYLGFTRYWDEFGDYLLGAMGGDGAMDMLLGEVVSRAGIRQLRLAETQKFRHVTSFFNGKSTKPYPGEDQVEVPSRFDPATFASHPEMEAYNVTDELLGQPLRLHRGELRQLRHGRPHRQPRGRHPRRRDRRRVHRQGAPPPDGARRPRPHHRRPRQRRADGRLRHRHAQDLPHPQQGGVHLRGQGRRPAHDAPRRQALGHRRHLPGPPRPREARADDRRRPLRQVTDKRTENRERRTERTQACDGGSEGVWGGAPPRKPSFQASKLPNFRPRSGLCSLFSLPPFPSL